MKSLAKHGPALLGSLITKLEQLHATNRGRGRGDSALQGLPSMIKKAQEVNAQFVLMLQDLGREGQ